ncbi:MAG: prephenate dehydrogenase [Sulfuriferula sp.]
MTYAISKLVVFGVGLIGGSLALGLKQARAVGEVVGVDRSATNLQVALDLGIIDRAATDVGDALTGADVVILAVPVGQMAALMKDISPCLEPHTIISDVGSTKQDVISLMQRHFARNLGNCVPAHPIAGAELSGATAACADLYRNKNLVLTPLSGTYPDAIARISAMWRLCGAQISIMSAGEHDAIFAAVSHLPHLLAYTLVNMIAQRDNSGQLFSFAASGFRDFTRIAGSSPEMWRDIAIANKSAILFELEAYQAQLAQLVQALADSDGAALIRIFSLAQQARHDWLIQNPPE